MRPSSSMEQRQAPWQSCHTDVHTSALAATSHIFTSVSFDPVTTRVPSGENATERTHFAWPVNVHTSAPVAVSHILARLSSAPLTIHFPSGEKATAFNAPAWPSTGQFGFRSTLAF
eukprot:CAMPEP_0180314888 /NCGR_PEP_ID=MMETSP0988-20121125/32322_1 /TAXON_ID=697907 /ORGANISM="non described non described, Strain CCMP2293" /LENGTH=115 /DNA_ID=CAMNT_0022299663 /DNA_START=84 /DNA_END=428 /DNA_ORIENTATION=-